MSSSMITTFSFIFGIALSVIEPRAADLVVPGRRSAVEQPT